MPSRRNDVQMQRRESEGVNAQKLLVFGVYSMFWDLCHALWSGDNLQLNVYTFMLLTKQIHRRNVPRRST